MSTTKQRRRLLIDSRYQLRHMFVVLTINLVLIVLSATLVSWFYLFFYNGNMVCDLNRMFPMYIGVVALTAILFLSLWCLYRSRSVAGMMCKIESVLIQTAHGHLPHEPLVFRKYDYFGALAKPINACIARMRTHEQQRHAAIQALQALQQEILEQPGNQATVKQKIETIVATLNATNYQDK